MEEQKPNDGWPTLEDFSSDQKWAFGCYFPVFNFVICLLAAVRKSDSPYVVRHARQGLVLFAAVLVSQVLAFISPLLSFLTWWLVFILHVVGLVMVFLKSRAAMPLVGDIADKIPANYISETLTGEKKKDNPQQNQKTTVENSEESGNNGSTKNQ